MRDIIPMALARHCEPRAQRAGVAIQENFYTCNETWSQNEVGKNDAKKVEHRRL